MENLRGMSDRAKQYTCPSNLPLVGVVMMTKSDETELIGVAALLGSSLDPTHCLEGIVTQKGSQLLLYVVVKDYRLIE